MTVQWNEAMIKKAMDDVNNASRALAANANRRLTCEALVIKLMNAAKEEIKVADSCGNTI
jgi:hypothetical protein